MVNGRQAQRQHPDLVQAADGAGQLGAATEVWPVPKTVERTGAAALSCDQQGIELRALFRRHIAGEGAPEATGGPGTNTRNQALKGGRPREQYLLRHQPNGRAVEQHARPVRAGPAQRVKPARQAEVDEGVSELAVAKAGPDFSGMLPTGPALAIQSETAEIGNPELARQVAGNARRHIDRVIQEGAQEPHRAELHGKAQPHVIPAFGGSQFSVGIVEVEVTGKLIRAGLTGVAAVTALLLCRQKGNWHRLISGRAACGRAAWPVPRRRRRRTTC